VLELKDVSFKYKNGGEAPGISGLSITIGDGECVLVCGESGCGKTTLTRLINGLIPHYYGGALSGKVLINGFDIAASPLYETASFIGSVFQNPRSQFFNVDTVSEIAFGCENLGVPEDEILRRVEKTVVDMKIDNLMGRSIFALSGGEKQKIACASVSALNPDVLVLDEPSSNLDKDAIHDLVGQIAQWKAQGKTIVIAEHRLHYLAGLADRIVYMREGSIIREYTWAELESIPPEKRETLGLRSLNLQGMKTDRENSACIAPDREWIRLSNFYFSYKRENQVLDIPSLMLPRGEIIAVIGPNGAGKSTFARCLCGLEKHCPGVMEMGGKLYKAGKRLKRCYMVMQDVNHQLFTETVLDEVLISMKKPVVESTERILESLDIFALKDIHPMSLSGGQKQRVAIATALASCRDMIIFDEPTSGMDLRHMSGVAENLRKLCRMGKTLIVITHDPELILACCTYMLHLEKGRIAGNYSLDNIGRHRMKDFFVRESGNY
jgi:energy-coupling factor transport system ATP-binding protein